MRPDTGPGGGTDQPGPADPTDPTKGNPDEGTDPPKPDGDDRAHPGNESGSGSDSESGGGPDNQSGGEPDGEPPGEPDEDSEENDMSMPTLLRPPVPTAAEMLLTRSREDLLQAALARSASERFVTAHLAALRAAAAVLATRARPSPRGGPRSVWEVLPRIAPEMGEWAAFFAATASRRAAVETGRETVTPRVADDLLRDADTFHHIVEAHLGLPYQQVLPDAFPPCE